MPSDRICPDADVNFKMSVDSIIARVGSEEIAKAIEKQRRDAEQRRKR